MSHQYVDYTQLYLSVPSNPKEVVDSLNQCLEGLMDWMSTNKLKLNSIKMAVLLVGSVSSEEWPYANVGGDFTHPQPTSLELGHTFGPKSDA